MEREYTCPMDPEVRQRGPGACPKCGMALEPVMVSADAGPQVAWRQLFGRLIGNSDMHPGNLAFFVRGTRVLVDANHPRCGQPLDLEVEVVAFEPAVPATQGA